MPEGLTPEQSGEDWLIRFSPAVYDVDEVLRLMLSAGAVQQMTLKEQDVDELVAEMYADLAIG